MAEQLEQLGSLLCASIAAGRYDEARQLAERCVAVRTTETHDAIVSILEKAREIAVLQRAIATERLAHVRQAAQYSPPAEAKILHAGKG